VNFLNISLDWDKMQYVMEICAPDGWYDVRMDGRTAEILSTQKTEMRMESDWKEQAGLIGWREAVELAALEYGDVVQRIGRLKVSVSGSVNNPHYEVSISFLEDPWFFYMHVDARTGEISNQSAPGASSKPVTPDLPTGILTPEQVLTLAMDYVPEHVKVAYIAGVEGYKGHVELTAMGDGWCYVTYIVSPEQTWTFLQDRHTGEILGSETDATDCEFKAWSQVGFFGAMEPDELYVLREYDELTKLLDGALPGMFQEDLFRERTVLGLCLRAPDSGFRFRISQVLRKADGNYVVSINASRLPFTFAEDHRYWTIFAVLEEEIPEGATVSYEITAHTDTYHAVDMDAVNTQYLLPADKVPWTWGTHLQWILHGDRVYALIDQGSFVYYCEPKTEDVDGDGIPELFLQDSKRIERCLRWDPAQGWFVPG